LIEWGHHFGNGDIALDQTLLVVSLLLFNLTHPDRKVLNKHIYCIVVFGVKWDDYISVFHYWLYKVIVGGLHEAIVLGEHVYYCAVALCDVSFNCSADMGC